MDSTLELISVAILAATLVVVTRQTVHTGRAAQAQAFGVVYGLLQSDEARASRRVVLEVMRARGVSEWSEEEIGHGERVCAAFDSVAIMCRHRMLPTAMLADSWGDSLRQCWSTLAPLAYRYRADRGAPELWDDFEWLAGVAHAASMTRGVDPA